MTYVVTKRFADLVGFTTLSQQLVPDDLARLVTLGLHHEQQHQELLLTDLLHEMKAMRLEMSAGLHGVREDIQALSHRIDNVVATLRFQDGSIANIAYLANGDRSVPKEQFEVFCEGKVRRINDFCTLELARDGKTRRTRARRNKGHEQEIELTLEAIRQGGSSPIPFEELTEVSEATIAIEEAIASGEAVSLRTQQSPAEQKTAENL